MEKILQTYLRRLTNLSGNNRSLLLLRLISDQFLDLHDLDFASNEPSFHIIEKLISQKEKIKLCDEFDARDSAVNRNSQKLRKISRIEDFIFQERGARDLYVGWPFVRGKFNDGTQVRCPLIFYPVSLTREKNSWYLQQRKDVNITFNKTFLLGYAFYNQISLDEDLIEQVLTDLDKDSTIYRTQLYEMLKQSMLEIHFNQENFMDRLQNFRHYKKAEFDEAHQEGALKLYPEAVLGIFPQAGSYLVPDYVKLLEQPDQTELEHFFAARYREDPEAMPNIRFSDKVKEETTFAPFEMDASQEHALKLVKNGNSLVVQGPPGTGKSQLICNLISDFIARGKNVLLVCQKKAALDVVYERLRKKELHDFIGLVHDFKNDRKNIFEQVARQIDSLDEYRQKNNGLDAIHLERSFLQSSRKIDQITEELDDFKKALFDETECGKSVKELYLSSDPNRPSFALNQQYRQFDYSKVSEFITRLSRYLDYHQKFEKQPHFWADGVSFSAFSSQDYIRLRETVIEVPEFQKQLQQESAAFASSSIDFETGLHFLTYLEDMKQLRTNLDNDLVFANYKLMMEQDPTEEPAWLNGLERTMLQCFKSDGLESTLPTAELGRFQEALEHAINARKNVFSWIKWRLFSSEKIFVKRIIVANELKNNREGFEILLRRVDNRLNFEHIVSVIAGTKWLSGFPESFRKIEIQNWFFYQKIALKTILLNRNVRILDQYLPVKYKDRKSYIEEMETLFSFLEKIPLQQQLWANYLTQKQVRSILLGKIQIPSIQKLLTEDFDTLVEYHKIRDHFSTDESQIIASLTERENLPKEEIIALFENSLALAWVDHIETKYPILRAVSSFKIDHLTQDLQLAIADKTSVSEEILLLKSRERTYENLEYNRLNNLVTYKELYHQVTKKRKVWPIRKVISQFREELFSLLPCWLASPESASAIFPMEEIFDLVIFDEASQCFAERGIPAMYRGKQVVVVGDDKQLQPNDLYRVRWEDDTEDTPELEVDSLLDLAKQYLNEAGLRGHYRSRSLELIEFSNRHFYDGKLKLLPDYHLMKLEQPAIHYIKKDGIWAENTNLAEAMEVVDLISKLSASFQGKSIGVVTFNASQQSLILDLLEERLDSGRISHLPEGMFIKNIENVQGDERDIIIFSTAYAPDEKGTLQLRFGSLNQAGGENRLNVAITRAREKIYVVTSLLPHQLKTEQTANPGPKLLKAYLEYAKTVSDKLWLPYASAEETRNQKWYLRNKLAGQTQEATVVKNLPFSDLTVRLKSQNKGLILTDDDLYFDSLTAKEAHSYRQMHLAEMNWPFTQFYSREYWISRDKTRDKLQKYIHRLED